MHQIIKRHLAALALSGTLILAQFNAQAALVNGSFEGTVPPGDGTLLKGSTAIPGWTVVAGDIAWGHNGQWGSLTAKEGTKFLDLSGYHDNKPYGGVSQSIGTVNGQRYEITFNIGSDITYNGTAPQVTVTAGGTSATIAGELNEHNYWAAKSFTFTATGVSTIISIVGSTRAHSCELGSKARAR